MSMVHSNSVDSTSSVDTMTTIRTADLTTDPSNGLYDDRSHFQAIFSNDSRFFDTSLHLFKSYFSLGYINSNDDKNKNLQVPLPTTTSSRHKHRLRQRLFGSTHDKDSNQNTLKGFLTPTLFRRHDHSTNNQNNSHNPPTERINHQKNPTITVHYQRSSLANNGIPDDDNTDEPDVAITRL